MPYNLRQRKAEVQEPPVTKPAASKKAKAEVQEPPVKKPAASKKRKAEVQEPPVKKPAASKKAKTEPLDPPTKTPAASKKAKTEVQEPPTKTPAASKKAKTEVQEPPTETLAASKKAKTEVQEPPTKTPAASEEKTAHICNQLVFGQDSCGELGFGKIGFTRKTPTPVRIDEDIKQVFCGPMHTLSLTQSGKVYAYGCNDEGALGRVTDGDEALEATPAIVPLDGKVIKVTAGDSHSAALTDDNRVFIWGNFRDEHGSVGLTVDCNGEASHKPIQVLQEKKLTDIASGSNHMLLLDSDGIVYSFGVGTQGQLGRLKPEEIVDDEGDKINNNKKRELFLTPKPVSLKNVDPQRPFVCDAVFAGNFSSFATNTDKKKNRLAGWGLNNYFQLGYKGQKDQLVQYSPKRSTFTCSTSMINVACGPHHTLFLTKTGRLYAAGRHDYGMLGLGNVSKEVCPAKLVEVSSNDSSKFKTICAGINTSFGVNEDGQLFSWGMSGFNLGVEGDEDLKEPTEVKSLEGKVVTSVSTGGSFTAVLI